MVQAKLRIGAPDNHDEKEANRVASIVMRMPRPPSHAQPPIRQATGIRQLLDRKEELPRNKSLSDERMVPQSTVPRDTKYSGTWLQRRLNSGRGNGASLPQATRSFMEDRFGADFGGVRVHSDPAAVEMNEHLQARAFTHGHHIYFHAGQYAPGTTQGQKLLAHELTHVIQQRGGAMKSIPIVQMASGQNPCTDRIPADFTEEDVRELSGRQADRAFIHISDARDVMLLQVRAIARLRVLPAESRCRRARQDGSS